MKEKDEIGKKPVAKRKTAGWTAKTHPKPHDSPLWAHLELIRKMRLGRRPWREIAEAIEKAGGPKVAFNTVHNFYKRVANRAKSGKGLPLGFEDPFAGAAPAPAGPAQPDSPPEPTSAAPAEQTPDQQAAAIEAARARIKARSQQPEKPKWDFGYDPTKPLKPNE